MRISIFLIFGLLCWQTAAPAQTINDGAPPDDGRTSESAKTGVIGGDATMKYSSYAPLTTSERLRLFVIGSFGPGAILRAAAAGAIMQAENTPKEWQQGSEAYGKRFGTSFGENIIRQSLQTGAGFALHEDDRYFRSTEPGLWKRTKHAVGSVFVARNEAGGERFAYSRIGAAAGASFISRAWQPRSTTTSGDAAVNFGITMVVDMGWNVFKEFRPAWMGRHF